MLSLVAMVDDVLRQNAGPRSGHRLESPSGAVDTLSLDCGR